MRGRPGPSPVIATNRAAYFRLRWAAAERLALESLAQYPSQTIGNRVLDNTTPIEGTRHLPAAL